MLLKSLTEVAAYEMLPSFKLVLEQKEGPFRTPADIIHPLLPANLQGTIIEDSRRSHLHRRAK